MGRRTPFANQSMVLLLSRAFRILREHNGDEKEARSQLRHIADQIAAKRIAVGDLAEALQIGTRRLHGSFSDAGISLMTAPGTLPMPDCHLIELRVRELREIEGIEFGYRHTAECITLPGQSLPYNVVYQILHPLRAPMNGRLRVPDAMFVAKCVDHLWPTDLHELH
jgi:hypothetical protein